MSRSKTVFLYSGMGSQYFQMGRELFHQNGRFRYYLEHFSALSEPILGESIVKLVYDAQRTRTDDFSDLKRGAAALLCVQCAMTYTLVDRGLKPDLLVGASLGESAAGIVGGALEVEQVLRMFAQHTDAIGAVCEPARLLGVFMGADAVGRDPFLSTYGEVASMAFADYSVLVVRDKHWKAVLSYLSERDVTHQPVSVHQGFHSSVIDPALDLCREAAQRVASRPSEIPILSCATLRTVERFDPDHFWNVLREPIRFHQAIAQLEREGPHTYVDVGPSGTLATYTQHILARESTSRTHAILSMFGRDVQGLDKLEASVSRSAMSKGLPMKALLFPGQGSQQKGMGKELFEAFPKLTEQASGVLGYDIRALCLEDAERKLRETQYTQPALYVVGALSYLRFRDQGGAEPRFTAGHSLGEYNALFAAGVFDFETGLGLVKRRGELMAEAKGGSMLAVLGLSADAIDQALTRAGLTSVDIANYNTPNQTVVAGPKSALEEASRVLEGAGARCVPLSVSAAFHSRYMERVKVAFGEVLSRAEFKAPAFGVIANATARLYEPARIAETLTEQLQKPVRWVESMQFLLSQGEVEIQELGHGSVLTNLLRDIRKSAATSPVEASRPIVPSQMPPQVVRLEPMTGPRAQPSREAPRAPVTRMSATPGEQLGSAAFRSDHGTRYAYYAGAMGEGVSSVALVARLAKAGILGVLGTRGLSDAEVATALRDTREAVGATRPWGVDFRPGDGDLPRAQQLCESGATAIEVTDHLRMTPALVYCRLKGAHRSADGVPVAARRLIIKTSRVDIAERFLQPAPSRITAELAASGYLTPQEVMLAEVMPLASDLCVRSDGADATEPGASAALLSVFLDLRDKLPAGAPGKGVRIGMAGGIGAPASAASAFLTGADFVCTGSINQCTVEAATGVSVKEMLQQAGVQDTAYVPDAATFEIGGRAQVLKRGLFFPVRANKAYEIYRQLGSVHELDVETRKLLEQRCFGQSLDQVWSDLEKTLPAEQRALCDKNPKTRLGLLLKSYLVRASELARRDRHEDRVQFHVPCSPAMGAFNAWVKGTPFEPWQRRHVDEIADHLMESTAVFLNRRLVELATPRRAEPRKAESA